jgi:hypothetical protein
MLVEVKGELIMTKSRTDGSMETIREFTSGYAPVNGLNMYYEIHGTGQPLVLLHGAFSAIGTSFGALLPGLSKSRLVRIEMCREAAPLHSPICPGQ